MKHGMVGVGIYWCLAEMLYEESGILPTEYDRIAFELRTDSETVKSVIEDFDLFQINDNEFTSKSVLRRLDERAEKSQKARESALNRWNKSERNATAMRPHDDRNAIKDNKGKEIKGKERNNNKGNGELLLSSFFKDNFSFFESMASSFNATTEQMETAYNYFDEYLKTTGKQHQAAPNKCKHFERWMEKTNREFLTAPKATPETDYSELFKNTKYPV